MSGRWGKSPCPFFFLCSADRLTMWVHLQGCVAESGNWPEEQDRNWRAPRRCGEGGAWGSDFLELLMNPWAHPRCAYLIIKSIHRCWELNYNTDSSPNATLATGYHTHKLDWILLHFFETYLILDMESTKYLVEGETGDLNSTRPMAFPKTQIHSL